MNFSEQCQKLDARIRSCQVIEPFGCYVTDGIVNLDKWRLQKIRPLFIGKEAHGDGFGNPLWSIVNWLDKDPAEVCYESPYSWHKTAYISYSLQNHFIPDSQIPWIRDDESVAEALRTIAFINIGKYTAETTIPWNRLASLYAQNSLVLHDQIELYQPNVIIGWNTLSLFENDSVFTNRFAESSISTQHQEFTQSWLSNGKLFISAYHPASRVAGLTRTRYIDDIVNTVKENYDSIDVSLPLL